MENQKKRPLTLAGTIVNIIFGALDVILMIVACLYVSDLYYQVSYYLDITPFIITYVIEIAFATTIIILASLLCAKCKRSVREYNKCSGLVITLFVFNCLAVLSSLINIIGNGNYIAILTMLVYGMCGAFVLVDLCLNKKALKTLANEGQPAEVASVVQPVAQPVKPAPVVKEKQSETIKRPLTLAGTIVNIVIGALDIILMIWMSVAFSELSGWYGSSGYEYYVDMTPYIVSCVIEIGFAIAIIIMASLLCARYKKSIREYDKSSGLIITLFVFNCLAVLGSLVNICIGNFIAIVTMLTYAMCGAFILVDFCRNKKALKKLGAEVAEVQTQQAPVVSVVTDAPVAPTPVAKTQPTKVETPVQPVASASVVPQSKLFQTLKELKEMKELGIIDEDEYKKLKAKAVDKAEF